MDFTKVPIGFGMELAQNEEAMARYAGLSQQEKQAILNQAHRARSEEEMRQIVSSIAVM